MMSEPTINFQKDVLVFWGNHFMRGIYAGLKLKKQKTTHSKHISQTGSFPQGSGVKIKQGTIPNPTYGTYDHQGY